MVVLLCEDVEALIVLWLLLLPKMTATAENGVIGPALLRILSSGEDEQVCVFRTVLTLLGVRLCELVVEVAVIEAVSDILDAVTQVELLRELVHFEQNLTHKCLFNYFDIVDH